MILSGESGSTEDAGHDGDAGVLGLALRVVHAEGLEGGEAHGFMAAGHGCGFFVGKESKMEGRDLN